MRLRKTMVIIREVCYPMRAVKIAIVQRKQKLKNSIFIPEYSNVNTIISDPSRNPPSRPSSTRPNSTRSIQSIQKKPVNNIPNKYPLNNNSSPQIPINYNVNIHKNEPKVYKYESPFIKKDIHIGNNIDLSKNRPNSSKYGNNVVLINKKVNENEKFINTPGKNIGSANKISSTNNYANINNNFLRPTSKLGLNKKLGENLKNSGNNNTNPFLNILKK